VPAHSAISPLATATQNQPLYPALPAAYIIRQMVAFKNGERTGGRAPVMIAMAKVLTDADVKAAAEYYAALKPRIGYNKVIGEEWADGGLHRTDVGRAR
jgi:cytochrome c553